MEEEIKLGDVVQLKSGGPKMTVKNIGNYNYNDFNSADCDWFVQEKAPWKKEHAIFPLHALRKVAVD